MGLGLELHWNNRALVLEPLERVGGDPVCVELQGSVLTTEVWFPPLSKMGPSILTSCHIAGHGRTETSWMALNLTGIQQASLEVLRGWHEAVAGC